MACRALQKALSLVMALGVMACSLFLSKETRYLMSAKNGATQADVKQHLGEPVQTKVETNGHSIWVYETRTHVQEGTNNAWTTFDSWRCDLYTLIFDESHILRDWSHASRACE